jgi:hypothetical protein
MIARIAFFLVCFLTSLAADAQHRLDDVPPVSSAVNEGVNPNATFRVTITAQDFGRFGTRFASGVREIRFSLDPFMPDKVRPGDRTQVEVPMTGGHTLIYWAVDNAGNEEYPYNTMTFEPRLDVTPALLELSAPVGGFGPEGFIRIQGGGTAQISIVNVISDSPLFVPSSTVPCGGYLLGVICPLGVRFFAPAAQEYNATLYLVTDYPPIGIVTVALRGRGVEPHLTLTPNPVEFPNTAVGSTSAPVTVQIGNSTVVPLTVTGISTGAVAFPIVDDRCPAVPFTLAAGANCEVDIAFEPYAYGLHPGALEVEADLLNGPAFASFEAFGTLPAALVATPSALDFGVVPVGKAAWLDVRVSNDGKVPFPLQGFSIVGPGAAMYRISRIACVGGAPPYSLEPRQYCDVTVIYMPTASGIHPVVLRTEASAGVVPFDVSVNGEAN